MSGRWSLLAGGTAPPAPPEMWEAAAHRLRRWVEVAPAPVGESGGAHYERAAPAEIAAELASVLARGDVAVMATGPGPHTHHGGDVALRQAVDRLPGDVAGCVVGSFAHAAALTRLVRRRPAVRALVVPPVLEALGDPQPSEVADELAAEVVRAWSDGPVDGFVAPRSAVVGHPGVRDRPLGVRPWEPPPYRCIAPGRVRGRVWAGSLVPLALELDAAPLDDDAVVLAEPAVMAEAFLDVVLGGASASRLQAVAVGVPPWPIESVAGHFTMVRRMFEGRDVVGAVGGFAGTAVPAPCLELGRWAEVELSRDGIAITWDRLDADERGGGGSKGRRGG